VERPYSAKIKAWHEKRATSERSTAVSRRYDRGGQRRGVPDWARAGGEGEAVGGGLWDPDVSDANPRTIRDAMARRCSRELIAGAEKPFCLVFGVGMMYTEIMGDISRIFYQMSAACVNCQIGK